MDGEGEKVALMVGLWKPWRGGPFWGPEPCSSAVLVQHSQLHHTGRQKGKGKQVDTHGSAATLSVQSPASFPSTADQPTCLSSAMWRSTSVLCSLKQQPPRCFRGAQKLWVHVSEKNTRFKHLRWCNMTNTRHGVCRRRKRKSSDRVGSELTLGMKKRNFTNKTSFCCCWLMLLPVKQTYHNWIVVIAHHILTATAPKAGRRSPPGQKTSLSLLLFEFLSSLLLPLMLYLHDGSRIDWIISILSEYANSSSK